MSKPKMLQEEWQRAWDENCLNVRDLWDAGFRPRSDKYRHAVKEWKYHKKYYSVTLTLDSYVYAAFKDCYYRELEEVKNLKDLQEYRLIQYLHNKFRR